MQQLLVDTGHYRGSVEFRPHRTSHVAPKIIEEIKDAAGIVTHYLCEKEDGKTGLFLKGPYDAAFGVKRTAIKPKYHKGRNPDQSRQIGEDMGVVSRDSRRAKNKNA